MIPLICIEGPTASGKTALALSLAQSLNTQIISADSRQVYKYLNIGTAKPEEAELSLVPHHLIDFLELSQSYNAGNFAKDAHAIAESLHYRGMIPIVAGGTGLYVKALLEGLCELPHVPANIRESILEELKSRGSNAMHEELVRVDPIAGAKISPTDGQRISRALEVYRHTGKALSSYWASQPSQQIFNTYRILVLPERQTLYQRIESRLDQMLQKGLLQEISSLLDQGYTPDMPGLNTLGYKEFMPYFAGQSKLEECLDLAKQHTRNYAKRQITWYRKYQFDLTIDSSGFNIYDKDKLVDKLTSGFIRN